MEVHVLILVSVTATEVSAKVLARLKQVSLTSVTYTQDVTAFHSLMF